MSWNRLGQADAGSRWMASFGQHGTHWPQPLQRSAQMAMRAGWQGTSIVEQYFTHFAQQKFMGSSMA
jgi:hypothetical protein